MVKDLFRLMGLKTSLCNRAYLDVSERANQTASAVTALTDAGAQVLGMTKLSSLISREEPTEAVDYPMAFNPRGDGYQSPAGSSNGSAVAVAAYTWVDFAIGTDTSGSGRRPALVNGIFQLRPTHDAIHLEGMVPTFEGWDTPCLFGRDITRFEEIARVWYASKMLSKRPKRLKKPAIIYPLDFFPVQNIMQMDIVDLFISDLERYLGVVIIKVSITSMWDQDPPLEGKGQSVEDYLKDTVINSYYRDFYNSTDKFRATYRDKHHKEPFVTPFNHWRWEIGEQVSEAHYKDSMHRLSVYKQWFLKAVMQDDELESLLVLPIANVEPNYRDTPPPEPTPPTGFDSLFIPPILGSPDLVVPLGEIPYHSRISNKQEFLPVAVDIVGLPGADLVLIKTIQECLIASGRKQKVHTGSRMFLENI